MTMDPIIPHYIRHNATSRVPNRWVFLDTEAVQDIKDKRSVQTWRLGVTCFDKRETSTGKWSKPQWVYHLAPKGLWQYVTSVCRPHSRTIVAAHNMGYDARISDAFRILPELGWTLERWQVSDRSCLVRWRQGDAALWLADSMGWLPMSLERIGGYVAQSKEPLPEWEGAESEWWARCAQDVAILREAMMQLIQWVRDDDLGNWQATAGSMAWANWRHKHMTDKVLIHSDVEAREAERTAAWSGRCEAWKWGRMRGGKWAEYDLPLAYPRVCLDTPLPIMLRSHVRSPSWQYLASRKDNVRWLCRAEVTQSEPVLPCRHDGHTVWGKGSFSGWYWDGELEAAAEAGATIKLTEGYRYYARPALAAWAEWIIGAVEDDEVGYTDLQRVALKAWARALVGRFGTRYKIWDPIGDATDDSPAMGWVHNVDTDTTGRTLSIGGKQLESMSEVDGVDSAPAVMSAVMSECRLRLWQIMGIAGIANVAYCDTDSVIVNPTGAKALDREIAAGGLWGLRPKHHFASLQILGPRQLVVDGGHRISGMSRGAQRTGQQSWAGERWEGVEAAVAGGRPDRVVITPTAWTFDGSDPRRGHALRGRTYTLDVSSRAP